MTDGVEVTISGLPALSAEMKGLSVAMRKKIARAGVRKGATIIREAAKAAAQAIDRPETPLSIAKNIAVQFNGRMYRQTGDVGFRVGVRGGAKQYADTKANRRGGKVGETYKTGGTTWYWRLIEFGTSRFAARPFLRPAMENNAEKVLNAIVSEMSAQLARAKLKGQV